MQKTAFFLLICFFLGGKPLYSQTGTGLKIIDSFWVAGNGGWDYLNTTALNDWLYVSHGTQVNIINKKTGEAIAVIENTPGVHGIAFDELNKRGFISNGKNNTVTVFDVVTNNILAHIPTGQNPDAILYDPFSKKVITCNGGRFNLSVIDPLKIIVTDSVELGGKPEAAVSDGNGLLYVNLEDKNEIVVVDMKNFEVIRRWSLAPAQRPTGLAIDLSSNRLFAGCDKQLVVLDALNGTIVDRISIGSGGDGVAFDSFTNMIYTSNGDGTLSVIHEDYADRYAFIENIPTRPFARTMVFDKATQQLYLPTADFETPKPNQKGRPPMIPGTFKILVVGKEKTEKSKE